VINGKTGWLVEPESVAGLESAVIEALDDLGRARQMAGVGRDICRSRFPWQAMVDSIAQQYHRLLEAEAPP